MGPAQGVEGRDPAFGSGAGEVRFGRLDELARKEDAVFFQCGREVSRSGGVAETAYDDLEAVFAQRIGILYGDCLYRLRESLAECGKGFRVSEDGGAPGCEFFRTLDLSFAGVSEEHPSDWLAGSFLDELT